MINFEKGFYNIDDSKVVSKSSIPSWGTETVANTKLYYNSNGNPPANTNYPASCTPAQTVGSTKLYKLNGTTNRTGLEYMIKVMAGDHIDIFGKSYYLNTTSITNGNSTALDLLSLMTGFLLSPANAAAAKGLTASQLNTINSALVPSSFFRGNNSEPTTTIPKAYINYIFLDEQFRYVGGNASRVGASGVVKDHWQSDVQLQNITVPKNGYIFVYVSNESNFDVFFDNLQVIHKPGPLLEETHYYPFGLTMAGISSKALNGTPENKYRFNKGSELQNKEFSDGSGLELYATNLRSLDPQLGRWWQIDSKPDYAQSLYSAMNNNPISFNDPLGDTAIVPLLIPQKKMPYIYQHTVNAQKSGKPILLTYDKNKQNANKRRNEALKGQTPAKPGNSLDEYPYASTTQGGKGASVQEVPAKEQNIQGGIISSTAQAAKMQSGDQFLVIPVPDADDPNNNTPAVGVNQQQKSNDNNGTQNAPDSVININPQTAQTAVKAGTAAIVGYVIYKVVEAAATWECGGCGAWLTP